jgi:Raf kinase inhibitor-like YbhB/YbcL family protein
MKRPIPLFTVLCLAATAAAGASAQTALVDVVRVTAFDRPDTQAPPGAPPLEIVSSNVMADKPMLQVFSAYGKNVSPPIAWSVGPDKTKAYVLIVQDIDAQDPDSRKPEPLLHWLAYNIPPQVHALNRGIKNIKLTTSPLGMMQGWNSHESFGYTGPHPPVGAPAHRYVFQIYAVDRKLSAGPGAHLDRVLSAMRGHVIARGEVTALYAEPAPKPPAAAPSGNATGNLAD